MFYSIAFNQVELNADDIQLRYEDFNYEKPWCIRTDFTESGCEKLREAKVKTRPYTVCYLFDDTFSANKSVILMKTETTTYEIDPKLLYSLYLKHRIEFNMIVLKCHKRIGNVKCKYLPEIELYIDTLLVDYIKPTV